MVTEGIAVAVDVGMIVGSILLVGDPSRIGSGGDDEPPNISSLSPGKITVWGTRPFRANNSSNSTS